jgi:L-iditol 2-dehydrogenase
VSSKVPALMDAWILGNPGELSYVKKSIPSPGKSEVLIKINAVAICATDLEVISHGDPALIKGGPPFNQEFTPGHEFMGTIVELGVNVDEFSIGDRVAVEIHAGCGRCDKCRSGMYTSCLNYGLNYKDHDKGHRANGYTTDGAFTQYAVNHINTLVKIPNTVSDEIATLIVTAGTAIYGLDVLGGLIAGQAILITGAGPIGLMAVAAAKALGASPIVLSDIVEDRLTIARALGADVTINPTKENMLEVVKSLTLGKGVEYGFECSGAPGVLNELLYACRRGGRICLGAFSGSDEIVDIKHVVSNNLYLFGIRGEGRSAVKRAASLVVAGKIDPSIIHTHTFNLVDLPKALDLAKNKTDGAIKVIIKVH